MIKKLCLIGIILSGLLMVIPTTTAQQNNVRLAYIQNNVVTLADYQGTPLAAPGPELQQWDSANLFWSPDGETLYIATRNGLFATGAGGGAAVRLPGEFGLTVVIARHGGALYNIDTDNPQEITASTIGFPLRETNIANMEGGRGRMVRIIGEYATGSNNANISHAAALYARDDGLLEAGRPRLYATYGGSLFYSCCFPNVGLSVVELGTTDAYLYDGEFITAAAAMNTTRSRLAAPTTTGAIRIYDLLTAGSRDYLIDVPGGVGAIERIGWALDENAIYFVSREPSPNPLELLDGISYPADTRSALMVLWRLDLVSGRTTALLEIGDLYGISSMAVTGEFVYLTLIERNDALIQALNDGTLAPDIQPNDPALDAYIPRSVLVRIDRESGNLYQVGENIWGVRVRPY